MKILTIVFLGAFIGWITNYIAIKMLFRPHREINLFFFKLQGLIPKRRKIIAESIADTIESELISIEDITEKFKESQLEEKIGIYLDKILDKKLKQYIINIFPPASLFMSNSMLEKIKKSIKNIVLENKDEMIDMLVIHLEENIDFKKIIKDKINDFSVENLEKIIFMLAKKELKHIEIIGALLGGIIGLVQYFLILFMN